MDELDDIISDHEEEEGRNTPTSATKPPENIEYNEKSADTESTVYDEENQDAEKNEVSGNKTLIGVVELFFAKINVAAIRLTGQLKIGDIIEIENGGKAIKFVVSSMQIDKKNVTDAAGGESIGIKVSTPVKAGSNVYIVHI